MENIGKKVVALLEKKVVGFVLKPFINFRLLKKTGYVVVDDESEQEYFVGFENIKKIDDCVLIESSNALEYLGESGEFRKRVLSVAGEDLGRVREYAFRYRVLKKVVTDKCEISAKNISDVGDDVLFVNFSKKRRKFPRSKNENAKVVAMNEVKLPAVVNLSSSYYIGKVATKMLLGLNHELIVKDGTKITKQIFDKAKKHNRLNELFFIIK